MNFQLPALLLGLGLIFLAIMLGMSKLIKRDSQNMIDAIKKNSPRIIMYYNSETGRYEWHIPEAPIEFKQYIQTLNLSKLWVLELEVGNGSLSQAIWEAEPEYWFGYIGNSFSALVPGATHKLIEANFMDEDFDYLSDKYCLIANPPVSTLDFIEANVLSRVPQAVLLIPESLRDHYVVLGFETVSVIDNVTNKQFLMQRGF